MIILTKYSVLEYLLWIRNNKYSRTESNISFCNILNDNLSTTRVLDIKYKTRNLVFEFVLNNESYIFKQFGPDLDKKIAFFLSETFILNQSLLNYIPKIVFQDDFNKVIIVKKLINYTNFGDRIRKLYETERNDKIKVLLKNTALKLKEIHSSKSIFQNVNVPKYTSSLWRHFFIDKPEFESYYPEFLHLWKDTCLVHYDLSGKNILFDKDGGIKIIDWEMSELGDPYYDLCSIIRTLLGIFRPSFFSFSLPTHFNEIKRIIIDFLHDYDLNYNKNKIELFFKIHNHDLYNEQYYLSNIEILFK